MLPKICGYALKTIINGIILSTIKNELPYKSKYFLVSLYHFYEHGFSLFFIKATEEKGPGCPDTPFYYFHNQQVMCRANS